MNDSFSSSHSDELIARIALSKLFINQPRIPREIIAGLGSAAAVFGLSDKEIHEIFGPRKEADELPGSWESAVSIYERLDSQGIVFIDEDSPLYPARLREIPDAPLGLYVKAESLDGLFDYPHAVAVVGTRDCSSYGEAFAKAIVEEIASCCPGCRIISGLAKGIDIIAHKTALEKGLPTFAVTGTGLEKIYPAVHEREADQIASTPGCALISEYSPDTNVFGINFLCRNRIVAAMSDATIVLESRIKGGSMSTARLAFDYGRSVYALPGRIDSPSFEGCNHLIRERVAETIESVPLLMKDLGFRSTTRRARGQSTRDHIREIVETRAAEGGVWKDNAETILKILLLIASERDIPDEDIILSTGLPYNIIAPLLALLESEGLISRDLLCRNSLGF